MLRNRFVSATCGTVAIATALAWAPSAEGFKLGGTPWPGGVVRYHSSAPAYSQAIRDAVRAWNESGAKVRLRETSKARADLHIQYGDPGGGFAGAASLGRVPDGLVSFHMLGGLVVEGAPDFLCGKRMPVPGPLPGPRRQRMECLRGAQMILVKPHRRRAPDQQTRVGRAVVVTHELGHVLGLKHNHPACAVMSYKRDKRCRRPSGPWQIRCRLLERDDVRGAIARYGGRMRPLGREFCDLAPAPRPPSGVTAKRTSDGRVVVTWNRARGDTSDRYRIAGRAGDCPTKPPSGPLALPRGSQVTHTLQGPKHAAYCVAVWHEDAYGRLAGPVTVTISPPANAAPQANFTATEVDVRTFVFEDGSTDDGEIVAWSWAFGDGATSSSPQPQHTYAAAGTYTVTLTVTDDRGATASTSQTVQATDPPNAAPTASFDYEQYSSTRTVGFTDFSYDEDGAIVAWQWDFGDGATSTDANPEHLYAAAGDYTVTLTVTDDRGATHSTSQLVTVFDP